MVAFVFVAASPRNAHRIGPRCIVIAGPNGAGKTTFAQEFLPNYAGVVEFVNSDLIAAGLSPFRPREAAMRAGRLVLLEINRLADRRANFAIESTLSGLSFLSRWKRLKAMGYRIEVIYISLPSPEVALRRIAQRVRQGGHAVDEADVRRRFQRSWTNFCEHYRTMADAWMVYDNSGNTPQLIESWP